MSTLDVERKEFGEPASDANTMVEKDEGKVEQDTESESLSARDIEGQVPENELAPSDYPHGLQFFFILLALILSIFMVALDLVGSSWRTTPLHMLTFLPDNRRHCNPQDHR